MLDQSFKDQITGLFSSLKSTYVFQIEVDPAHASRGELVELLEDVASCSHQVSCSVMDAPGLQFRIVKDGIPSSFVFRAVPNGHEFTSLLLAVLNQEGIGKNLPDDALKQKIQSLRGPVLIKSYISLTCTNCPDVVQSLNAISILNPMVEHEIIDGGINQQEVELLKIQAVPTVFVNGTVAHVGRASLGELLEKIEEKCGVDESLVHDVRKEVDVVVAGGGPAGVSAAIYAARKGFKVVVVADHIGGQVSETSGIENLISVPQTNGTQLAANLFTHLKEYSVEVLTNRKVASVGVVDGYKQVTTSLGETLIAPMLIIATGAGWRRLNVPGESEHIGSGVAFCTHCDGPFYKGKRVAVIGGGNSGLEAAIDLSSIATQVTLLEFLPELKGDQVLQDKLYSLPNVAVVKNAETQEVKGSDGKVNGLVYRERSTGDFHQLEVEGVFVQIGLMPNSAVFRELVKVNRFGEIEVDAHCRTNVPGVYAAGDVTTVPFKQIVIAMGEGSKAALSAFEDNMKGLTMGAK
jgi:alkyl hydroperoxide reductase subunit F